MTEETEKKKAEQRKRDRRIRRVADLLDAMTKSDGRSAIRASNVGKRLIVEGRAAAHAEGKEEGKEEARGEIESPLTTAELDELGECILAGNSGRAFDILRSAFPAMREIHMTRNLMAARNAPARFPFGFERN